MPPRLRVLLVDHTAELAGGEVALSRLLAATDPTRFDTRVLLLATGPLVARLQEGGIPVAVLEASERLTGAGREDAASSPLKLVGSVLRTLAIMPRMIRAIRSARADLVVANTLKAAVLVSIAAPLAGRRWVWHLHDRLAVDYLPWPLVFAMRLLARVGPRVVVANSEATRATLRGTPERKIVVTYPGLEVSDAAVSLSHIPRDENHPSIGLLGRIAPTKGQREFLQAAKLTAGVHGDARFVVIGDALFNDAPFADRVRSMPASLGIAERVEFTGWIDDPRSAIASLTVLVHASPVPEPFGQVLVEAMLTGTPVIGTNAGGVPEILGAVADGQSHESIATGVTRTTLGLLVRPGDTKALSDAMNWMLEHPSERTTMAEEARLSAIERFDIRATVDRVAAAWIRASGRRAAPPNVRHQ
jgi:glycosyltransferase involved in cell wall biosynthesis